jgi:ubiquinone/menaquinone biosynthesis C-methylase UbiE
VSRFPEAQVTGVDVSPGMIEEARGRVPPASFEVGDASHLPFGDGSFDLVTHTNMIPFLDEVARVLRPGGWTVFAYTNGVDTPIYVRPELLRQELDRRGFADFADIAVGRGTAVLARRAGQD